MQNDEFLEAFSQLRLLNSVIDEVSNCLEKFVCALYGYKNETTVNKVRVKIFQMKGISHLARLPPCKDNLKLHISPANYVANIYVNAIRLYMCLLDDPCTCVFLMIQYLMDGNKTSQFNEEITVLETCDGKELSISEQFYYPFSLHLEPKTCHKYPPSFVCAKYLLLTCDQVLEK